MRVLVTGALGFVGKYLVSRLLSEGHDVTGIDQGDTNEFPYFKRDIRDGASIDALVSEQKPDAIIHLAAISFVPTAEKDFGACLAANVLGTVNLLSAAAKQGTPPRIIFISSAEVYGKAALKKLPIDEQAAIEPSNNYSLSKVMAEEALWRFERDFGLSVVIARPFNHVGPGQNENFVTSAFAKQLAEIKHGKQKAEIHVGDLDAKRDFSDVRDIVRAYSLLLSKGAGIYNLCSGKSVSIQTILDTLISLSGLSVEVKQDPARMRPNEIKDSFGSYNKALKDLGWEPAILLEASLKDIYSDWLTRV